jgi:hypothetical protein
VKEIKAEAGKTLADNAKLVNEYDTAKKAAAYGKAK